MKQRDLLLGLLVVVVWGLNFIAIKFGLITMPPLLLGAVRFFFAVFPAIFFLKKPPATTKQLIALGLAINVGQFSFLFLGMKLGMAAGLASLILQSQAFFTVVLASVLIKEKIMKHHLQGLVIAFVGIAIIAIGKGASSTTVGLVLTLIAGLSWALGNIIIRKITSGISGYPMLSLIVWAGAVAIIPLALLSLLFEGFTAWKIAWQSTTLLTIASVVYLSYIATLVGYGLWGMLLSRYQAGQVAPLSLLIPVVGLTSATLLLKEVFNLYMGIGSAIVLLGLIYNMGIIKKTSQHPSLVEKKPENCV